LLPAAVVAGVIALVAYVRPGGSVNQPVRRKTEVARPPVSEAAAASADDVWETEEFAEAAGEQLNLVGKALASPAGVSSAALSEIVTATFSGGPLRPAPLEKVFDSDSIRVLRWRGNAADESPEGGADGFVRLLTTLAEPLHNAADIHVKFKLVSVDVGEGFITTKVIYQAGGRREQGSVQQSANWLCRWKQSTPQAPPLLEHIQVESFEEVIGRAPTGTLFADCTRAVFRQEPSFETQILPGIDYWRGATQAQYGV